MTPTSLNKRLILSVVVSALASAACVQLPDTREADAYPDR